MRALRWIARHSIIAAVLVTASTSGCGTASSQHAPRIVSLRLEGSIRQESVDRLLAAVEGKEVLGPLTINSPGGAEGPTLELARMIQDRGISLVVDGICASACAQILAPAAPRVTLTEGSLIAFHGSIIGWAVYYMQIEDDEGLKRIRYETLEQIDFLREVGAKPEFLVCTSRLVEPSGAPFLIEGELDARGQPQWAREVRRALLTAGSDTVRDFGIRLVEERPRARKSLAEALNAVGIRSANAFTPIEEAGSCSLDDQAKFIELENKLRSLAP
jgi:hypothetical protein